MTTDSPSEDDTSAQASADGSRSWDQMAHDEQIRVLRENADPEILARYTPPDMSPAEFEAVIRAARRLWRPDELGEIRMVEEVPDKRQLLGAPRDIDRTEALLELIDNSIDVWRRRKQRYPDRTASELAIYIDYDERNDVLTYEDNAGGIPRDIAHHLVIPGHSETSDRDFSIGSYRTGGKKAIFKLARDANIETRYVSPTYGPEERYAIQLDEQWLNSSDAYGFPTYDLPNAPDLEPGQTRYTFAVRDKAWDTAVFTQTLDSIRRVYSLLLVRNPKIHIYFNNRSAPLTPMDDLYTFTWAENKDEYDLRPQGVSFKTKLPHGGEMLDVEIEIVLGARTSVSAAKGNDVWGIDFYGNDRLFKAYDQSEVFEWYGFPSGAVRQAIRGYVNIHGPNVLVPWDTHKRYINSDTETVRFLRRTPAVRQFFDSWKSAYNNYSRAFGSVARGKTQPWIKGNTVNVAFTETITIDPAALRRRNPKTPNHKPLMVLGQRASAEGPSVSLVFTDEEYRQICERLGVQGDAGDRTARREVADGLKKVILDRWLRGGRRAS